MRRASRGPIMLPANMPRPSGTTAAQSTGPTMTKMQAEVAEAAPISMFLSALARAIRWSTACSSRLSVITPDPAPK